MASSTTVAMVTGSELANTTAAMATELINATAVAVAQMVNTTAMAMTRVATTAAVVVNASTQSWANATGDAVGMDNATQPIVSTTDRFHYHKLNLTWPGQEEQRHLHEQMKIYLREWHPSMECCPCGGLITNTQFGLSLGIFGFACLFLGALLAHLFGDPFSPETWDLFVARLWWWCPGRVTSAIYRAYVRVRSTSNYHQDLPENLLDPNGQGWEVHLQLEEDDDDPDRIVPAPEPSAAPARRGLSVCDCSDSPIIFTPLPSDLEALAASRRPPDDGLDEEYRRRVITHDF